MSIGPRRRSIVAVSLFLAVMSISSIASPLAGAASQAGTFYPPSTVPGVGALGATGFSEVQAASCTSSGDCVDVGIYGATQSQGFIDVETGYVWEPAIHVPGVAALGMTGLTFTSLSCSSTGNCAAGGLYNTSTFTGGSYLAFVVDEVDGVWGSAEMVPGTGSLGAGSQAQVVSISCPSDGNCSLGGFVDDSDDNAVAFVADQVDGTWQSARLLTNVDPSAHTQATISSISCTSAGDCVAGGYGWNGLDRYQDQIGNSGFIVAETSGVWAAPVALGGVVTTSGSNQAQVNTVSCSTSAECEIGGTYYDGHEYQAFIASDLDGTLGSAIEVPGTATLNAYSMAQVVAASCTAAGECTIAGTYEGSAGNGLTQTFVDSEVAGTWGTATQIPEESSDLEDEANLTSLSCGSPGNCVVGGWIGYSGLEAPYVDMQSGGEWSTLQRVASEDAQNAQASSLSGASCAPNGGCELGGYIQGMFGWYGITVRYDLAGGGTGTPGAPTSVKLTLGNGVLGVSWTAPASQGGHAISSYTGTASPNGTTCVTTGATSCELSGLSNGTTYSVYVVATNSVGDSARSSAVSGTPFTTPGAPKLTSATPANASIKVIWTRPKSNGGSRITGYSATATRGGRTFTCRSSGTSCTIRRLANGKTYTVVAVATNAAGNSLDSNRKSVTPKA